MIWLDKDGGDDNKEINVQTTLNYIQQHCVKVFEIGLNLELAVEIEYNQRSAGGEGGDDDDKNVQTKPPAFRRVI